jgi:hypothetical protein
MEPDSKTEEKLNALQLELDLLWDKIQELKLTDTLAAQILYEKYKKKLGEIPPPIPSCVVEDQAVS